MKYLIVLGAAALAAPLVAAAQTAPPAAPQSLADRVIDDPHVDALRPYGQENPPEVRSDKTVQFGKALRMRIDGPNRDDWHVGIVMPTVKPVKAGDAIVIAFWARAQRTEGGVPGRICRVQLEATPVVRTIFQQPFDVTPEWKMYKLSGKADLAYAPGALNAAFHLSCAKQIIDIGPVFILNYGQ